MVSKTVKYIDAENSTAGTRCGRVGEMGRCWLKGTKFQVCSMDASRDLMYRLYRLNVYSDLIYSMVNYLVRNTV